MAKIKQAPPIVWTDPPATGSAAAVARLMAAENTPPAPKPSPRWHGWVKWYLLATVVLPWVIASFEKPAGHTYASHVGDDYLFVIFGPLAVAFVIWLCWLAYRPIAHADKLLDFAKSPLPTVQQIYDQFTEHYGRAPTDDEIVQIHNEQIALRQEARNNGLLTLGVTIVAANVIARQAEGKPIL